MGVVCVVRAGLWDNFRVAFGYRGVCRDQPFLLPPDMREWLPGDHLVWFLLDVIDVLDTSVLYERSCLGGVGRAGYDPEMLFGLWLYASARGITSSRQIERACHEDVAFRVLCAQDVPDHTVLCRFRRDHEEGMAVLFSKVLALCVDSGLGRFGVVAIDGTKIKANASSSRTVSLDRLYVLAERELAKAEEADCEDETRGVDPEVPSGWGRGSERLERIRAAIDAAEEVISEDQDARIESCVKRVEANEAHLECLETEDEQNVSRWREGGRKGRIPGRKRQIEQTRKRLVKSRQSLQHAYDLVVQQSAGKTSTQMRSARRNTTDVDSRVMRDGATHAFVQAYNAQLAVSDDGLILTALVTDHPADADLFVTVMNHVKTTCKSLGQDIGVIVADNGYLSNDAVDAPGPDRLIAPGRGKKTPTKLSRPAKQMADALTDPDNQAVYARRSVTVEPTNATLKDRRGLRQFQRRGQNAVQGELYLAALTTNLLKLFKSQSIMA